MSKYGYAHGKLWFVGDTAYAGVYDTRTGKEYVTDNTSAKAWQNLLREVREDVFAIDKVLFMGHKLKPWSKVVGG